MEDKTKTVSSNIKDIAIGYTEILKDKIEAAKKDNSDEVMKEIRESIKTLNPLIGVIERMEMMNETDEKKNPLRVINYYTNYED